MERIDWDKAPEGATHLAPAFKEFKQLWARKIDGVWHYHTGVGDWYYGAQPSKEEEYIPRPSPAWSGEGLPPAGVVCEYQRNDVSYKQAWVAVTPRYIGESITVLKHSASGNEFTEMTARCVFRPFRTPEQIAADERDSALHMAICDVEEKVAKWNTTIDCTAAIKATIDVMISLGYRKP